MQNYLDVSFGLVSYFHQKLGLRVDHVLQNTLINSGAMVNHRLPNDASTYTAPRLSELETKRYSFPSASSWSRTPECKRAL